MSAKISQINKQNVKNPLKCSILLMKTVHPTSTVPLIQNIKGHA